jgi:16S rRNA pseudouridine516 synthase
MRRLDQLLANLGYCSRREARQWTEAGRVTVRGAPADDPGAKADPAEVRIDGEPPDHPDGLLLLLHKPAGLVCSHNAGEGPRIYDLLPERWLRRNPPVTSVGRLDRDTTGLLLLTDQSALVHRLTSPRRSVPKVYEATVNRDVAPAEAAAIAVLFAAGTLTLENDPAPCLPATLEWTGPRTAVLTLTEGRFHQVKRMFESRSLAVTALHRSRFANLEISDLPPGRWRELPLDSPIG